MAEEKPELRQAVTPEVIAEAGVILDEARFGTLATLDPSDGHPVATRVNLARDAAGRPLIFVSALAPHTPALRQDGRCALLVGEPGKGDPIAHPRLSLRCHAREISRSAAEADALKAQWLVAHPKAKLYIELPDFTFFVLEPERVSFVAGFGRAYEFAGDLLARAKAEGKDTSER